MNRPFEPIGILPRSIIRTLQRFGEQFFKSSDKLGLAEFQYSRYQILVSLQVLIYSIFIPLISHFLIQTFILVPMINYLWNDQQDDIFLTAYLEKQALEELEHFEEALYFTSFITEPYESLESPILKATMQRKIVDLALEYNDKSMTVLTTFFGDVITVGTLIFVLLWLKSKVIIFKSFTLEFLYSFSDSAICFR
jgi:hypothetical protein